MSKKTICSSCGSVVELSKNCTCRKQKRDPEKMRKYYQENKASIAPIKTKRWQKLRKRIINRDNGICQRCFLKYEIINYDNLQVHHIKPRKEYPELIFEESNLMTMCRTCNLQLGTKELDFDYTTPEQEEYRPMIF